MRQSLSQDKVLLIFRNSQNARSMDNIIEAGLDTRITTTVPVPVPQPHPCFPALLAMDTYLSTFGYLKSGHPMAGGPGDRVGPRRGPGA